MPGNFVWKEMYKYTEPGINAEGVRVYPFDRSFPIDVSFHRVSGPRLVRLNRHEFLEIMYIYSGKTKIQVRDRVLSAKAGDLVVVGPNLYHRILYKASDDVRLVSMNFQPEVARSGKMAGEEEYYLSPFLCQGSDFPHVISNSENLPQEVFSHIVNIHKELPARTLLSRMAIRTYLKMILFILFKYYANHFGSREMLYQERKNLQRLQPVFELLEENFSQPIKVQDAARCCAMSASHFMRFFKMTVGQTFRSYLISFRVAKAQHMLINDEVSLAEISQEMGFCSQSYFGEVFKALVGTTPRTYRCRRIA